MPNPIEQPAIAVTCAGSAGSATGNTTSSFSIYGALSQIYVDYGSAPNTTVITVAQVGGPGGSNRTLFVTAAGNTNGYIYPRNLITNAAGAAITNGFADIVVAGRKLIVTVTLANDTNVVTLYLVTKDV